MELLDVVKAYSSLIVAVAKFAFFLPLCYWHAAVQPATTLPSILCIFGVAL